MVVVRNRSGAEVSRTPIRAQALREPGSPEARAVNARVPGRGAARVEIHDGTAIATAEATRHAPTATITSPSRGATIGGHGRFTVRWRAGDADGDPVQTTVQFSSDGGRRWQTLAADVHGTKVRLRRAALPRTRRGVLRVIVSDGFNVARSSARRLHTEGGRPQVDITFPAAKHAAAPADATVVLESSAVDLAGRPLSGRRLVWRSRGNRIGRGLQIAVPAYRLGRTVTVTGRDRAGARGRDTVRMRIRKVAPEFTTLRGARLAKTAGRLRLRLASTLPATVTARGPGLRRTTARLGGAARVIEVKIKAGALNRHSYRIALTLAASGKTTRQTLRIRRR